MIKINKVFLQMVEYLDIFTLNKHNFDKNNIHRRDFEVCHNNRFIKKEMIDMNDMVERIANQNIQLVKKN